MHQGCPPRIIRRLVSSQQSSDEFGDVAVFGKPKPLRVIDASLESVSRSAFSHIHAQARMPYVGWYSTCQLAVFSSAEVSWVCLELRSSGVCRSRKDTITATGILAPRVEMRHIFLSQSKKKKKKKNKLNYSNLHCRLRTVRTGCRDLIWCEFNHPNPTDASSPRSLTQHQIDAREGKRQQIQQTHRAGLRYLQGLK